jgi:hypothetical protein
MAIGVYGTKRPADVDPKDVEVIIVYSASRNSAEAQQTIKRYAGSDVIKPLSNVTATGAVSAVEIMGGLYNLELPSSIFKNKGIYGIYIRPVQIRTTITDCGSLSAFPDIAGLVFDVKKVPSEFQNKFVNNGLDGYRIEYLSPANQAKIPNLYRIVTSSFLSEAITEQSSNANQKTIRYKYNNAGSLLFVTVTPNTAASFKPTSPPFIGQKGQNVIISNTNFNPQYLEVEMVDYDMETLNLALYGEQSKSIDDGIYTLYDFNGNIFAQYDLYEIRDASDKKLFEVRKRRTDIDYNKSRGNVIK